MPQTHGTAQVALLEKEHKRLQHKVSVLPVYCSSRCICADACSTCVAANLRAHDMMFTQATCLEALTIPCCVLPQEYALQHAIHSIEGPLALVKECVGPSTGSATPAAAPENDTDRFSGESSSSQPHSCCHSSNHTESTGVLFEKRGSVSGPVPGLAAASFKDSDAILQQLSRREERVQGVMRQLGSCDDAGYQQLYTTQLLQRATADPLRMAGYLNTTRPQRLDIWKEVCPGPLYCIACVIACMHKQQPCSSLPTQRVR